MRILATTLLTLSAITAPALADDRVTLGFGTILDNDAIGDGEDRWRSGSYALSVLRGQPWVGRLPGRLGELLEYRLRLETITAADGAEPAPEDRRYAGLVSLGARSHAEARGFDVSVGGDMVLLGEMTQVGQLQRNLHSLLDQDAPDLAGQLPDAVYPSATVEVGRAFALGNTVELRPFVEASAGVESYVRMGGDLRIGGAISGDLLLRDTVTGQRYRGTHEAEDPGLTLLLGADTARVFDSYLLPGDDGYVLSDHRSRMRAGVHWQGENSSAFYGITWLSEEHDAQPDAQAVGSLQLRLRF